MLKKKSLKIMAWCFGIAGIAALLFVFFIMNFKLVHREGFELPAVNGNPDIKFDNYPVVANKTIKNIIFFIGDGMGIAQINLTRLKYYGSEGRLNMEKMPFTGLVTTHSNNNLITDSAAGATALATGRKTNNGMIGMTPDGESHLSILKALMARGVAAGLVTTTYITDATPAAFASHVPDRDLHTDIAKQLIEKKLDFLAGDFSYFFPAKDEQGPRHGEISLLQLARDMGYHFVDTHVALDQSKAELLLAHFPTTMRIHSPQEVEIDQDSPTLSELTAKAIQLLSRDEEGFFLLIEEEGTDTGGHVNRLDLVTQSCKNLDNAVKVALEFAAKDSRTLVLVTSDHETGGMTFSHRKTSVEDASIQWATSYHTGQMVPIFAYGPHASNFSGVLDNTDIPKIIARLMSLDEFERD